MARSKKINLSKFFRQDSASPSGVGVRDDKGVNPEAQVIMSGSDLSGILNIIQTNTEITTEQQQFIQQEDQNDYLLQGMVNSLQQRIFGLQSSLSKLQSEFQSDLLSRQRQLREKEKNIAIASAEASKQKTTSTPAQSLIQSTYEVTPAEKQDSGMPDTDTGSGLGSLAGGVAGALGTTLGGDTFTPPADGKNLSTAQMVALARQVGMTKEVNVRGYKGPLDVLMGAVGMQESGGNPKSKRDDTQVYGLWQIQFPTHVDKLKTIGVTSPEQLSDPITNAKAAKLVYDSQGITAWEGFTDGNYKKYLPEAQKASQSSVQQTPKQQLTSSTSSTTPAASSNISASTSESSSQIASAITPQQGSEMISVGVENKETNIITPPSAAKQISGVQPNAEMASAIVGGSEQIVGNQAPIIVPINNTQPPVASREVSSGSGILGGSTENMNNFYPSLARAVLGIA